MSSSIDRSRRTSWARSATTLAVVVTALTSGCTVGDSGDAAESAAPPAASSDRPTERPTLSDQAPASRPPATNGGSIAGDVTDALTAAGDASAAIVGDQAIVLHSDRRRSGPADAQTDVPVAWSTIKVPLVMAALDADGGDSTADMQAAIVQSDNASAERVWSSLGPPAQAGAAVQQVLAAGSDATTTVQTSRVRSEYSAFGQTHWSDAAAAGFASRVPCSASGRTVAGLMARVGSNQQWGLAGRDGVAVKGGWGPDTDGRYLVRQLAIVQTTRGNTGVMISVRPSDGTQATGEAEVTRIAAAIAGHLAALPTRRC